MKMATEPTGLKEVKKLLKPLVEKRRRDRMNRSLEQLKTFLLKHTHNETFQNGKMEKAEILEMTVQYLKTATLPKFQGHCSGIPRLNYQAGFQECLLQVTTFVQSCASINAEAKSSLMDRLADFVNQSRAESQSGQQVSCGSARRAAAPAAGACDAWPGHTSTLRPLAVVPGVAISRQTHQGLRLLAGQGTPLQQAQNPVSAQSGNHELVRQDCAHFGEFPQKAMGSQGPVCEPQGSSKVTVPHNVWRPWP